MYKCAVAIFTLTFIQPFLLTLNIAQKKQLIRGPIHSHFEGEAANGDYFPLSQDSVEEDLVIESNITMCSIGIIHSGLF